MQGKILKKATIWTLFQLKLSSPKQKKDNVTHSLRGYDKCGVMIPAGTGKQQLELPQEEEKRKGGGHNFGCAGIIEHPIKSLNTDCDKVPNTFKLSSTVHRIMSHYS